jgi:hypothetical protein
MGRTLQSPVMIRWQSWYSWYLDSQSSELYGSISLPAGTNRSQPIWIDIFQSCWKLLNSRLALIIQCCSKIFNIIWSHSVIPEMINGIFKHFRYYLIASEMHSKYSVAIHLIRTCLKWSNEALDTFRTHSNFLLSYRKSCKFQMLTRLPRSLLDLATSCPLRILTNYDIIHLIWSIIINQEYIRIRTDFADYAMPHCNDRHVWPSNPMSSVRQYVWKSDRMRLKSMKISQNV